MCIRVFAFRSGRWSRDEMTKTKITVHVPNSTKPLTFHVDGIDTSKDRILFLDKKIGKYKSFPSAWCEIEQEEVVDDE